jgi:hypothetical protein
MRIEAKVLGGGNHLTSPTTFIEDAIWMRVLVTSRGIVVTA